jgi:hypothetical protein
MLSGPRDDPHSVVISYSNHVSLHPVVVLHAYNHQLNTIQNKTVNEKPLENIIQLQLTGKENGPVHVFL